MKRVIRRPVTASTNSMVREVIFTPADVMNLLMEIEALKPYKIAVDDVPERDGVVFTIGETEYRAVVTR